VGSLIGLKFMNGQIFLSLPGMELRPYIITHTHTHIYIYSISLRSNSSNVTAVG
jgi:hypothetical protein